MYWFTVRRSRHRADISLSLPIRATTSDAVSVSFVMMVRYTKENAAQVKNALDGGAIFAHGVQSKRRTNMGKYTNATATYEDEVLKVSFSGDRFRDDGQTFIEDVQVTAIELRGVNIPVTKELSKALLHLADDLEFGE